MPASTSKKVIAVRFDREILFGYVAPGEFRKPSYVELLTPDGGILQISHPEIKSICFVKNWESGTFWDHKRFRTRPKGAGLWVRFEFRDQDTLEALLPNRLLDLASDGFDGIPPEAIGNVQRVFIPRAALLDCLVLGVIGASKPRERRPAPTEAGQMRMFD